MAAGKKSPSKQGALRGGKEVSAMGWIEDVHGGLLLVRQKRGRKFWTLPGGKILPAEKVESGLKREIHEETGTRVARAVHVALFDRPEKRGLTFLYRVTLQPYKKFTPKPREIDKVEFHSVLPKNASPSLRYFWKTLRHPML